MDATTIIERWSSALGEDIEATKIPPASTVKTVVADLLGSGLFFDAPQDDGPFALIEPLGEGGMGVVYRAREHALGREVALKMLKPERSGAAARRRFAAEATMTGRLEHPNIVPVHRLDAMPNGNPFMAMKLVGGQSWHEQLRSGETELTGQLEILLQISNAVAFAHSRGIVHNDLKPANVMLGAFGEVQLLDWGLAVSFWEQAPPGIPHKSAITSPCGTPHYMAPELANGEGQRIGVWTDIYLLGAILYRVLSGRAPHHRDNYLDCVLSASSGRVDPLQAELPEALRAAAMRALEAEPQDRFPDVQSFQAAIRAYLQHRESLLVTRSARTLLESCQSAAQGGGAERDRRYEGFAEAVAGFKQAYGLWEANQRARQGELDARLVFAEVALGYGDLGLATTQAHRIQRLAVLAESPAQRQQLRRIEQGLEQARAAIEARRRRQRRLARGLKGALVCIFVGLLVGFFWISSQNQEIRDKQIDLQQQIADSTRRGRIAEKALNSLVEEVSGELVNELASERAHAVAARILPAAIEGWQELLAANLEQSRASPGSAEAHRRLAELVWDVQHDAQTAREHLVEASKILAQLGTEQPNDEGLAFDRIRVWIALGMLESEEGRLAEGMKWFERVLEHGRQSLERFPNAPELQQLLADGELRRSNILQRQGDLPAAILAVERALAWQRRTSEAVGDASGSIVNMEHVLFRQGAVYEAAQQLDRSLAAREELLALTRVAVERNPNHAESLRRLCDALQELVRQHDTMGQTATALGYSDEAVSLLRHLHARAPESFRARYELQMALLWHARLRGRLGEVGVALETCREALLIARALQLQFPKDAAVQELLDSALQELVTHARAAGQTGLALQAAQERVALQRSRLATDSTDVELPRALATACLQLANLYRRQGEARAAVASAEEAVQVLRDLLLRAPALPGLARELSAALTVLGDALRLYGQGAPALEAYAEATALCREAPPELFTSQADLAILLESQAQLFADEGLWDEADDLLRESLELRRKLAAAPSASEQLQAQLLRGLLHAARNHKRNERTDELAAVASEAATLARRLVGTDPSHPALRRDLATALDQLASAHRERGELEQAEVCLREALSIAEDLVVRDSPSIGLQHNLAAAHLNLGVVLLARETPAEALESFAGAAEQAEVCLQMAPEHTPGLHLLAQAQTQRGQAFLAAGAPAEAVEALAEALGSWQSYSERTGTLLARRELLDRGLGRLAEALEAAGDLSGSFAVREEMLVGYQELVAERPALREVGFAVSNTLCQMSYLALMQGDLDARLTLFEQAVANHRALGENWPELAGDVAHLVDGLESIWAHRGEALVAGELQPKRARDFGILAQTSFEQQDWAAAVGHFQATFALMQPDFQTLMAASQAAGMAAVGSNSELTGGFEEQCLAWLEPCVAYMRASIANLREGGHDASSFEHLWRELRDNEPAFSSLREGDAFRALFAEDP